MNFLNNSRERELIDELLMLLEIDIDERGVLSHTFMSLTVLVNNTLKTLVLEDSNTKLNENEVYFQPLNNNKHNKVLISIFLQQYPEVWDIHFEGNSILFLNANNNCVHVEKDINNSKEGTIKAILSYINNI